MNDKTEWELVDSPVPGTRRTPGDVLKALSGPYWRGKIAGVALIGIVMLALLLTLTGVVALLLVAAAILSISIAKLLQWLRQWRARGRRSVVRH